MMQTKSNQSDYFKQYPCYNFAIYPHSSIKINSQFNCHFKNSKRLLQDHPPAALLDTLSRQDVLFLLQWKFQQKTTLYIKQLQQESTWIKINLNFCPDHITIAGNTIFIVAAQELCIISPIHLRTDIINLTNHAIISVHPTLTLITHNNAYISMPAVYILYLTPDKQYYSQEYSLQGITNKTSIFQKKQLFFKRQQTKFIHFQLIIPNVLGLVFITPRTIGLYDLQQSKLIQGKQIELPEELGLTQKPVIRWKWHQQLANSIQTIMLVVGVGATISTLFLSFKTNLSNLPEQYHNQPISNFDTGFLLNCRQVQIKPSLNYIIDYPILVDIAITQKGLVYIGKSNVTSLISAFNYIQINNHITTQNQYPILNQESTILKYHYQDIQNKALLTQNKLLKPNRYPYDLVEHLHQSSQNQQYQLQRAFYAWRQKYTFRSLVTFGDDLLIVRSGSLSVFLQISQIIYRHQFFSQMHLQQQQSYYFRSSTHYETVSTLDQTTYNQFQNMQENITEIINERLYHQPQQDLLLRQIQQKQAIYQSASDKLYYQIISEKHMQHFDNMKIPQFRQSLICSRITDQLCQLSIIFNSKIFLATNIAERTANKIYQKETLVTKIIDYYYGLYFRSAEHHRLFGSDLISWYVKQTIKQLPNDIDAAVKTILQNLFKNLLPNQHSKDSDNTIIDPELEDSKITSNPFLEFVIKKIKQYHLCTLKDQKNQKQQCLRDELSNLLKLGFYNNKSIYFNELWKNKSLFKALLLSNQTQYLKNTILQYMLLKQDMAFILAQYQPLSQFVTKKTNSLVNQQTLRFILMNKNHTNKENLIKHSNKVAIQQSFFHSYKYNLKVEVNGLIPSLRRQSQNDDDEDLQNKIYELQSELFWKQVKERNNLLCNDHFQQINIKFQQFLQASQQEQSILNDIKSLVEKSCFKNGQHKLQFYQKMLISFANLFNQKVKQYQTLKYYQTKIPSSSEAKQFKQSRTILNKIMKEISIYLKDYLESFKKHYHYQTDNTINQAQFQKNIMSNMFIQTPIRLIDSQKGLILSTITIQLILKALSIQKMDPDIQYHDCLLKQSNLLFYFKTHSDILFPKQSIHLYKKYLDQYKQSINHVIAL